VLAAACMALSGCRPDESFEIFTIEDLRAEGDVRECIETGFPIDLSLFGARRQTEDTTGIMMRTQGGPATYADHVYLEIEDRDRVLSNLGEPLPLASYEEYSPVEHNPDRPLLRAGASLLASCPRVAPSLMFTGEVIFDAYDDRIGGTIEGELVEGRLIDARTGAVLAETLEGNWSMVVRQGPPYEPFVEPDRE
jgi:hypothetical protein